MIHKFLSCFLVFCTLSFQVLYASSDSVSELRAGFQNPPQQAKPQVWWHWTSDEINPKAMTADLESMKAVGLGGAYIFNLCGPGEGLGLTDSRLDLYRHAISEARRLGLELGMHNCPGWSSSGGPWIKPEDSMKFLIATETLVEGGKPVTVQLPQAPGKCDFYADVAVIAFPLPVPPVEPTVKLPVEFQFQAETDPEITVDCPLSEPVRAKYIELTFPQSQLYTQGVVEAQTPDGSFVKVADLRWEHFTDPGTGKILMLDWSKFPAVKGEETVQNPPAVQNFRIRFQYLELPPYVRNHKVSLSRVRFFENAMIPGIDARNSSTTSFGYAEPAREEAGIPVDSVLDLTGKMNADGQLVWNDAPVGKFLILRIGCTTTGKKCAPAHPKMAGLECDKLSRRGLDAHWPGMMAKILELKDPKNPETFPLKVSLIDSYEVGGQNWTFDFDQDFLKLRGYSMRPWFPALFGYTVGSSRESACFLYDFQRTVADCFARNYYDYFAELCEKNGLTASVEAYGGPFDSLQCSNKSPFPVTEFWIGRPLGSRYSSSAMRIHGRNVNGAESFTTEAKPGRWQQDPAQLRREGDVAWQEGVNLLILHSFVHQPRLNVRPGLTLDRHGSHFGRNNTWWKEAGGWISYLARGQFLLQSGSSTSEILILGGEGHPNQLGIQPDLTAAGYDFDYCDRETLHTRVVPEDGKIRIQGAGLYEIFSLGKETSVTLATLRVVKKLLDGGALVTGPRPTGSPSLADHTPEKLAEYDGLVKEIWDAPKPLPNFRPQTGSLLNVVREFKIVPGFDSPNAKLTAISRQTKDAKIFMVLNRADEPLALPCVFNVSGKTPEIWDAVTGKTRPVSIWRETADGRTEVRVELPAHGSEFFVFTDAPKADHAVAIVDGWISDESQDAQTARGFEILEAKYRLKGSKEGGVDVTEQVKKLATPFGLNFLLETSALGIRDPYSNQYKELFLRWTLNGKEESRVFEEHRNLEITVPGQFKLTRAEFRSKTNPKFSVDVTEKVRSLMTPRGFHFEVSRPLLVEKDPAPNQYKELVLTFEFNDQESQIIFQEHKMANLDVPLSSTFTNAQVVEQDGKLCAEFQKPGVFSVQLASGKTVSAEFQAKKVPTLRLNKNWTVEFGPNLGVPEGKITFDSLVSWTERPEPGIRFFSGTVEYTKKFRTDRWSTTSDSQPVHYILNLGEVKNLARVWLNGKDLGLVWCAPFTLDVTDVLKPEEENELRIQVTNLWVNRLIGDEFHPSASVPGLPEWVKKDQPNSGDGRFTWSGWKGWTKDDAPLPAGLLGPVTIETRSVIEMK